MLYEAPHRLLTLLGELSSCCGPDRPIQVARELTKRHEEQVGPTVEAALAHFQQTRPQGEFHPGFRRCHTHGTASPQ